MSVAAGPAAPLGVAPPPYQAALAVTGPAWKSRLLHDSQVMLSQPEVHVGILSNNDVVLSDKKASRLHAAIRWTPTGYVIQDLESQAGTFVDGQRITQPALLVPGQRIRIGDTELLFQQVGAPATAVSQSLWQHWMQLQVHKQYWRVFLIGLAGYIAGAILLNASSNNHLVPLVALVGAAVVPVAFALFCWEEGAFVDMPPTVIGLAFISGGLFGLLGAAIFESPLSADSSAVVTGLVAGVVEESVKAGLLVWFLRDRRLRSELDGLVLGVAVGMGFAALETAGYGADAFATNIGGGFLQALLNTIHTTGQITASAAEADFASSLKVGYQNMEIALNQRLLFAVFGHGMWTGMVGAAIWRERGQRRFALTGGVLATFVLAVALHAVFDMLAFSSAPILVLLVVPITTLFFAFFLHEAVTRAKLGPLAPPPPPLGTAMVQFFSRPFNSGRPAQLHPVVAAAMATAIPVQPGGPAPSVSPRFCPRCGAPATPGNRFCATCGGPLAGP